MLAALLAAAIWLLIASVKGWPVSTTHSIVGAIVGFGIVGLGFDAVQWGKIGSIVASWVVSPVLGGAAAFLLMLSLQRLILDTPTPLKNALRWAPVYLFLVGFAVALVTLIKGLKHLKLDLDFTESLVVSALIGLAVLAIGRVRIGRVEVDETADHASQHERVETIFAPMDYFHGLRHGVCPWIERRRQRRRTLGGGPRAGGFRWRSRRKSPWFRCGSWCSAASGSSSVWRPYGYSRHADDRQEDYRADPDAGLLRDHFGGPDGGPGEPGRAPRFDDAYRRRCGDRGRPWPGESPP